MTTLIEKSILNERLEKSRSGIYADTSENRRKHRVGQKYGSEKKEEEKPEKTDPNKMSSEQQLEAINKVIAAVNEGKLKLPPEEINTLVAKKTMAEEAVKQAKGEKKPEEKEESKKEATKPEEKSEGKQYALMDIKEAKKELVGKKITFKEYFFDKDAEGEIKKVRLYGKEKQPIAEIEFSNGDGVIISLEQLDKRKAKEYEIEFNDSKSEEPKQEVSVKASDPIYQVQQKKKEASKKYDSKREEARQKYDKEAEDKLYDQRQKEETSEEVKESYTRVKFEDVPNSGKVNLKKYLSDKVKRTADENLGILSKVSTENLKKMEAGLVKEFNSQFGSLSKSRRAEKLYSIMKVKSELENRKQEEIKKYQKYTSSLDDNTLWSIGYDLGEEIRELSSRGFSTLEQQEEVLKKISELSVKRQINEDEQRKRMDKLKFT